jgi:GT2 family glycosyltransferase
VDKVYIIILAWNQIVLTLDCIRSLLTLDYPLCHVVVVDNDSCDGTVETLHEEFGERIDVIANSENLGFTGGNNVGIRYALKHGSDFVMLLNNDTIACDRGLVSKLVAVMETNPSIGLASPSIYYADRPEKPWYAGAQLSLWHGWKHNVLLPNGNGPFDTGYASGCCVLASAVMIRQIGPLPESYFLNVEDVEWSVRARRAGWRVVYVPGASLLHKVSATLKDETGKGTSSPIAIYYMTRNQIWLIRHYGNFIQRWIVWPVKIGWYLAYHSLGYILLRRWPKLKALWGGARDGVSSLPVRQGVDGKCY